MSETKLKYKCAFCTTPTNFEDNKVAYCIDCYCKLRNSAHQHVFAEPRPLPIAPMPLSWAHSPYWLFSFYLND